MINKEPDISVIIPSYNRRQFTSEAIASSVSQNEIDIEVIVIDDGSKDDTCEWIRRNYPQIKLFQEQHKGAGSARNRGLNTANGRYLKFVDSDDLLTPGSLAKQIEFADQIKADVCYGDWEFFGELDAPEVGSQRVRIMGKPDDMIAALLCSWWGPPSIYLIRRDFIQKHNILWDETLKRNQDMDFILKVAMNDAVFEYNSGIVSLKRVHNQGRIMDTGADIYGLHCEIIADKVLAYLQENKKLTEERKQAVADLYWHASRLLWKTNFKDYNRIKRKIDLLYPHFIPNCSTYASPKMKSAVKLFGLRGAEYLFYYASFLRSLCKGSKK